MKMSLMVSKWVTCQIWLLWEENLTIELPFFSRANVSVHIPQMKINEIFSYLHENLDL